MPARRPVLFVQLDAWRLFACTGCTVQMPAPSKAVVVDTLGNGRIIVLGISES